MSEEWIKFYQDSMKIALFEWDCERKNNSACRLFEALGMLHRYGKPVLPELVRSSQAPELALACLDHIATVGHLVNSVTDSYDEAFDLAMCVDDLFSAWQVAHYVLDRLAMLDQHTHRCGRALVTLDEVMVKMTEGTNYEISLGAIMTLPQCLFYETAHGVWRALYAERLRRCSSS